jgi:Recombination endonuclease VII
VAYDRKPICRRYYLKNKVKIHKKQAVYRRANRAKLNAYNKRWVAKHVENVELYNLSKKLRSSYGLTVEQYQEMVRQQNGVCAICGRPPKGGKKTKRLSVDHCHKTGRIRGLLCTRCNIALGHVESSLLPQMLAYLAKGEKA